MKLLERKVLEDEPHLARIVWKHAAQDVVKVAAYGAFKV